RLDVFEFHSNPCPFRKHERLETPASASAVASGAKAGLWKATAGEPSLLQNCYSNDDFPMQAPELE
ncbi:MAG TPA: hypothetical protein PLK99_11955, partial [Burkholderiales bacterium]|nr:hypothetical protein [Burkholderiales bacterium]